ncbi:hypothetical protein KUTeg_019780 [Tegillarca granosa]|uniref:Purple acid phosphatase n=1 Tax=Tegillarca granosa TaxID=220873 RepID=A0ABQ9EDL3_TEGGR|nr:hypothetical protein KUTeg_019780 [Tegillarca granosa]
MGLMRSSRGCLSTTVCGLTMYSLFISLLWVVGHCSHVYEEEVSCHPEQVHIAFGDSLTEMTIMWSTEKNCTSEISYGTDPWHFGQKETGEMKHFTLLNSRGLQCLHRVKLKGLKPDTTYFYRPISNNISSGPFYFHTPTKDTAFAHEFLVYGDLGAQSDSIPRLDTEALSGRYSAVLHIGDFAYNMRDDGGQVGDVFMRLIEGISSRLPYMTSVGNHEDWSAFRSALPAFDSFGRLKIYNATHLYWEQIAVNTSKMIDNIWLVQNSHGPFKGEKLTKEVTNKIEEHKEETNKIIAATNQGHSKPEAETPESNKVGSVNYLADKKTKIVVGVSAGVLVIIIILTIALICRIRQRKPRKYRRWEQTVDYGRKFYSSYEHVGNNEKDTDDFEVDVTDGNLPTSKLLNDGDR